MSEELIYKKGILLRVVSWENDGDHYNKQEKSIETLEEALAICKLFKELFGSSSESESAISNEYGISGEFEISEFRLTNDYFRENHTAKDFLKYIDDLSHDLMGSSEFYTFRVCESIKAFEVKEDVYMDIVEIPI